MLSNQQIAAMFRTLADLQELLGEDRFKQQAYRRAADSLQNLTISVADYAARGALEDVPGVGKAISGKLTQLLATGTFDLYERLSAQLPVGVVDVMRVPGVGPKTALRLYQELGIADTTALLDAASTGKISALKGLGKKLEAAIIAGVSTPAPEDNQWLLGEAWPQAADLVASLRELDPALTDGAVAGSVRRAAAVAGDLNLVFAGADPAASRARLEAAPQVAAITASDGAHSAATLHNGRRCTFAVAAPELWGAALVWWTGSAAHRDALVARAAARGLRLDAAGLWRGDTLLPSADEAAIYAALELPLIAPELREGWGEIDAADAGRLPALVESTDLLADLHMHTSWSDGSGTVLERAYACHARGYHYAAITDHSAYMGMVQGLDAERLRAQRAEIDAANAALAAAGVDFQLLQGSEVDILPDGSLALPDDVLATLDWVVASLHVNLEAAARRGDRSPAAGDPQPIC